MANSSETEMTRKLKILEEYVRQLDFQTTVSECIDHYIKTKKIDELIFLFENQYICYVASESRYRIFRLVLDSDHSALILAAANALDVEFTETDVAVISRLTCEDAVAELLLTSLKAAEEFDNVPSSLHGNPCVDMYRLAAKFKSANWDSDLFLQAAKNPGFRELLLKEVITTPEELTDLLQLHTNSSKNVNRRL